MARKRKRRSFGEGSGRHAEWGNQDLSDAIASAAKAAELAQDGGSCDSANNLLRQAHGFYAAAVAHSKSGGTVHGLTMGSSTLANATRVFKARCKIVRK